MKKGSDAAPAWALDEGEEGDIEFGQPAAKSSSSTYYSSSKPSSYSSPSAAVNDEGEDDFDFSKPKSKPDDSKKAASSDDGGGDEEEDAWGSVGVKAEPKNDPQQLLMDQFYKDVENIKTDIDKLKNATKRILDLMEKILASTSEVTDRTLNNEMRQTVDDTNKVAKSTKNLLALLKEENIKFKKDKKIEASNMRIRENLCTTLTRKFIDEMKLYQSAQQKYKTTIQDKAVRTITNVKKDATPEEIDMLMKSDVSSQELFRQTMLTGVAGEIKQVYTHVAGKYQDIVALEQSVAELHQMFLDFALLTEQQGELLDQIEFNVKNAADYVEEANVQVFKAIQIQKRSRKKMCCIIICVFILVAIVLGSTGALKLF